jgi:uncharacterized protein
VNDSSAGNEISRFQILSLDGGGIRGIFTASILAAIEEDYSTHIVDHFDLIAGTSTGGIVALALGLGISPREIVEFYIASAPRIFPASNKYRESLHWLRPKYSAEPLREALKTKFGNTSFGESKKRLVIPAFNVAENDVYVFRTPHLPHLRRDFRVPAWQVAMATSAAPTYFPAFTETDSLRLIDGGVWANNPSLVALVEAVGPLAIAQRSVALLSIGTGSAVKNHSRGLDTAGKLKWADQIADVILDATSIGVRNQVAFLLGEDRFLRVDANVPADAVSLDNIATVDDLLGRARHIGRKIMPSVAKMFLSHRAAEYAPLHTHRP